MNSTMRTFARRFLPASIRKPLGNLCGKLEERFRVPVILPVQGLLFDLFCGGRFKANDCVFMIPKNITNRTIRGYFFDNTYEIAERELVQKFIRSEDSVLELGGCLGIISCTTNKRLRNQTRHLVIEANPRCIPALRRNRDLNRCAFSIENCAVSDAPEVTFFLHPDSIVSGTTKSGSALPVRVVGRSLPELVNQYGPFSVLIMDIEGSEQEVLESSVGVLRNFRLIIVEFHEWIISAQGANRCREILQQSGFNMAERSFSNEAWLRA
jgi:FkbM family methyltransferase